MFNVDTRGEDNIESSTALIFHHFASGAMSIAKHPVQYRRGKPFIGCGAPITYDDVLQISNTILGMTDHVDLLPPNILSQNNAVLGWFVRGRVRPMWFQGKQVRVPWPNLIFLATKGGLYIFAYKGSKRPDANTRLYNAPLMNVYHDNRLCFGSASRPASLGVETIPSWESAVFDTNFTHINHDRTLHVVSKGKTFTTIDNQKHLRFWRSLAKQNTTVFPGAALVPTCRRLNEIFQWIN